MAMSMPWESRLASHKSAEASTNSMNSNGSGSGNQGAVDKTDRPEKYFLTY